MKKTLTIIPFILMGAMLSFCKSGKNAVIIKKESTVIVEPEEKTYTGPKIIIKLDDFGATSTLNSSSIQALDYLISKNKKEQLELLPAG